jgi:hypothetical protein
MIWPSGLHVGVIIVRFWPFRSDLNERDGAE